MENFFERIITRDSVYESKWNKMKYSDKVESYTNLHIFPSTIFKKSLYPWETHFWLICIFWQDTVVSRIFTHASHYILKTLWQS